MLLYECLHRFPAIVIHRYAEYGQTGTLVLVLELDEPGDFCFTRSAPGRPKIQQDDFALVVGERDLGSASVPEKKIRCRPPVFQPFQAGIRLGWTTIANEESRTKSHTGGQ